MVPAALGRLRRTPSSETNAPEGCRGEGSFSAAMLSVIRNIRPVTLPVTLYGAAQRSFNLVAYLRCLFVALCIFAAGAPGTAQAQGVLDVDEDTYIIMTYGDSLMAGYGIDKNLAFPAQLERALRDKGYNVRVLDASISGDTTVSGMRRLQWSMSKAAHKPDLVILALGANDALRGIKPKYTRANLGQMIYDIRSKNIDVLLAGMMAPPNMGAGYGAQFNGIYTELANYYSLPLYPFFLHGVAGNAKLNIKDGVHPNPDGVAVMVEGIMPSVEKLLPDYIYVDPSLPPRDPAAYGLD